MNKGLVYIHNEFYSIVKKYKCGIFNKGGSRNTMLIKIIQKSKLFQSYVVHRDKRQINGLIKTKTNIISLDQLKAIRNKWGQEMIKLEEKDQM